MKIEGDSWEALDFVGFFFKDSYGVVSGIW